MADEIFEELTTFLDRQRSVLSALREVSSLAEVETGSFDGEDADGRVFFDKSISVRLETRKAQHGIPELRGAMFVQSLSNFEAFVKDEIQQLALRASHNCDSYSHLPKTMRTSLEQMAALVLSAPKKYRVEPYVASIVKVFANNLNGNSKKGEINHLCISITHENLRPTVLDDLFGRLGLSDVWTRIGSSAELQFLLQTSEQSQATATAQKKLNIAFDRRNSFVHPSGGITWPSDTELTDLFEFIEVICRSISAIIPIFELKLRDVSVALAAKSPAA